MRHVVVVLLVGAAGCDQGQFLPLLDGRGDLAGTYDPATGGVTVERDASVLEAPDGEESAVEGGRATLDGALVPGDSLFLLDEAGGVVETMTVGEADTIDQLSEAQAETTYPNCSQPL